MDRAIECMFAEYQKELLEEYDIFALEGGYETGSYSEEGICRRLAYYGAGNMEQDISRIQFLTDSQGLAFYEQVTRYMEHKYGISQAEELLGKTDTWRQQEEKAREHEKAEKEKEAELERLLLENEGELPRQDNPIAHADSLKSMSILALVVPKEMQVSEKVINLSDTVSHRELNQGYGDFSDVADVSDSSGTALDILFGEYVTEHFSTALGEQKTRALDYEIEYILEGKGSDRENLEKVAEKLLLFRLVPNYVYIQSDARMRAEAEALALTLCSLLAVPAITEAAAQVLLLAWAYGESVMDIRALLSGNRVPLTKSRDSWQLSLSSLLTLGTEEDNHSGADTEGGMRYEEYLRMLLFLEKQEIIGSRALDLIEQNLRRQLGQEYFRADYCISKIELLTTCTFRRGITYRFPTYFGYR